MTDSADTSPATGKGRATPSRKEREAANKRPLVAKRTKTKITKEDRRKRANERLVARQGYEAGDERYMPARDKGAQRRFVRDFVDARYEKVRARPSVRARRARPDVDMCGRRGPPRAPRTRGEDAASTAHGP